MEVTTAVVFVTAALWAALVTLQKFDLFRIATRLQGLLPPRSLNHWQTARIELAPRRGRHRVWLLSGPGVIRLYAAPY